ncbi:hypothetical protein B0A50_00730 [Salinomyces thailandicus]|uniref:Uncharacterized protein n=1 Tax=Salinomyces thailandicus TaxID=706561 RepID=A0A4U0UD53_9PEZI|nr:hypothetical protein B0A50_00730 [Salinomyces thailandica]
MDVLFGFATAFPIVASSAIAVTTGVAQGVSEQKRVNADASNQVRMLKFHLDTSLEGVNGGALHNAIITLHDDKVWVEPKDPETGWPVEGAGHPFTGFYIAYPDDARPYTRGLVSTISVDPPVLNWVYIDKDTLELKYASRSGSIEHHVGSFDWTGDEDGSGVTFDEWEGFVAVKEEGGKGWGVYFDLEDDGLKGVAKGRQVRELGLVRRVITGQEVNKWGLKEEGNIGFKKTREV